MNEPILNVKNLSASYGSIVVLYDISFTVNSQEIVCILGANGAGKTTTLLALSGLITRSGSIVFANQDLSLESAHTIVSKGLVHVPEGRKIFPKMSVHENLLLGAYLQKDKNKNSRQEEKIYSLFPILKDRRSQLGGTLSGGEQQMLAIGRALMSQPKLLLLDEPSMGIAPLLTVKIFEAIKELNKEGTAILLIEQNANAALQIADRAYVLELGRFVLSGRAAEVRDNPKIQEVYLGG